MLNRQQPYIVAENLSYELDSTQFLFQDIHLSISADDRIALVGANGVGKSTLLKILANQLPPTQGSVHSSASVYYLPQISTVRSSIQTETILNFLSAISNEWWQILNLLETTFNTTIDISLPVASLSGGELTKLFLAIGLSQSPNLLLLDEPTNHLDYLALEELRLFLMQFSGAFVIVSHKPFFLDQVVNTTWELSPIGITVYGGNYSLYREQKQMMLEAQLRSHEVARKELKRAKATAMQEQERAAQSRKNGRQRALRGDMPRIVAGGLKRKAEATAGTLKVKHDAAIAVATQKVAETKVKTVRATSIQLEEHSPKHRNLIDIHDADLWLRAGEVASQERLLIQNIQLQVTSRDRLVVAGANGSGKSCLAKAIANPGATPASLQGGEMALAPNLHLMYLDQTYGFVDRRQTVLENLQSANPTLDYRLVRQQLGHFLFFNDDVYKPAAVLSGGELARLAIAMITVSELDLLILDEPTNNLDVTTIEQMVAALNDYQGALWVISHDLDFLSQIHITHSFQLKNRILEKTAYLPDNMQCYYNELLT
ncbi:MAG: ABC-F family ATP-binding cassette domain-containing protein [Elainellaceae cyanobacterium]